MMSPQAMHRTTGSIGNGRAWRLPFLCFACLTIACSSPHDRQETELFTYNASDGVRSLDPGKAMDLESIWVVDQLYEGLLELDEDMNLRGALAENWRVSEDGLSYAFKLREGAVFHNGDPVTAQDVAASFERLIEPSSALPGRWVLDALKPEGGIEVVEEDSIQLHLVQPSPVFGALLATPQASILSQGGWKGKPDREDLGSGPFTLRGWIPETAMVLHRFPDYWMKDDEGNALPIIDGVRVEFNREPGAEFLGFKQGKYDFVSALDPVWAMAMRDNQGDWKPEWKGRVNEYRVPYLKTDYIGILMDSAAMERGGFELPERKLRKAMSLALDREALIRELRAGEATPAEGFVPPGMPGFGSAVRRIHPDLNFDPERARQGLSELGIGAEPPLRRLKGLVLGTKPEMADLAAALQFMWSQFGVDIEIDIAPSAMDAERVAKSQVPLFRKSWLADYPDAENFLGLFHPSRWCPDGPNYTHFEQESVTRLLDSAMVLPASDERTELLRQAEYEVLEEMPVIPLWHDEVVHIVSSRWTHWRVTPTNRLDLRHVRRAEE